MICKACGTAHTTVLPGNGWIELTMWILIPLWPAALIYSIWRRSSRRKCKACGSTDLVGLDTPVGRQLARAHHPGGLPATPAAPASAGPLGVLGAISLGILGLFAFLVIFRPGA